jgi:hypothetical protein
MWESATAKSAHDPTLTTVVERPDDLRSPRAIVIEYYGNSGAFMPGVGVPILVPLGADGAPLDTSPRSLNSEDVDVARRAMFGHQTIRATSDKCPIVSQQATGDTTTRQIVFSARGGGPSHVVSIPATIPVPERDRTARAIPATLLTPASVALDVVDDATLGMLWWTDGFGLGLVSNTPGMY